MNWSRPATDVRIHRKPPRCGLTGLHVHPPHTHSYETAARQRGVSLLVFVHKGEASVASRAVWGAGTNVVRHDGVDVAETYPGQPVLRASLEPLLCCERVNLRLLVLPILKYICITIYYTLKALGDVFSYQHPALQPHAGTTTPRHARPRRSFAQFQRRRLGR